MPTKAKHIGGASRRADQMSGAAMNTLRTPLGLSVLSTADVDQRIPIEAFASAVAGWADLVQRVTLELSGARPLVQWVVQGLRTGSTHVDLVPVLTYREADELLAAEAVRDEVPRIVVNGLERIEQGTDPLEVFSTDAAEHARLLVRPLLSAGIALIMVRNLEREVELTREGAGRQREAPSKLRSIGSVEGELKAVSFSETRPFFSIYRPAGSRGIKCYFDEQRFLPVVLDSLRQRVLVAGRVSRAEDGTPIAVSDVRMIRQLGGTQLPQPKDLIGIDPGLTEGLPSEEWLKRRRRG